MRKKENQSLALVLVYQGRPTRRPEEAVGQAAGGPCVRQSWDSNLASLTPKSTFLNHYRMPLLLKHKIFPKRKGKELSLLNILIML